MTRPNVLLITLDQFRADSLSCAGHPLVQTPNLDALAAAGVRFARHYSQAAPCSPGRAALYTGTYQMNNRVVANGTPLDARFDTVALAAQRAGYRPTLFGYTDQGVDPRTVTDPTDPRLFTYEGVCPGFEVELDLTGNHTPWLDWLRSHGHNLETAWAALKSEPDRPGSLSVSTFLTDRFLNWHEHQARPWFAHLSYLRPHPPYAAAGHFAQMYDPADCPEPLPIPAARHPFHEYALATRGMAAPRDVPRTRAQYYGMISEVDSQLGRVWAQLRERGGWDNTLIIVTADHGEQLGDQGLIGKLGFFESSYHVLAIVRDPSAATAGFVVDEFTENVDITPTVCEAIGIDVPAQCDGVSLAPFLRGERPNEWRAAATYEFDWRDRSLPAVEDRTSQLTVRRSREWAYVQFGDGTWRCFDLAADPTWQTEVTDPNRVLAAAQAMLVWRATHADRTHTGTLLR